MRVAIYARRSTDEHQAASLDVQLGEARRFCDSRGWTVVETFLEDAVSRAEFVKRPALIAMLTAAERKAFDVVVTRDETRLGGDMFRTGLLVQDLLDSGVRLYYYFTGECVSLDDPSSKIVMAVKAYAAEVDRLKTSQRTREHLEVKARQGVNVGGRVYGYDNIEIREGERRVRVEYRINETQAAVIRDVFTRYAAGEGPCAIARSLNQRGVPSPHAGRRGTGSWAPSTILDLIGRDRYLGFVTWGRKGSVYRRGTRVEIDRPASEWTRVERPDLAIIDEALFNAAKAQRRPERGSLKPGHGAEPKHLLSGIARCGVCGGPMQADRAKWGSNVQTLYRCAWAKVRGERVCANRLRRPALDLEEPIVAMLRNELTGAVIERALREVRRIVEDDAPDAGNLVALETDHRRIQLEIGRLATAIATTDGSPDALTRALLEREARARQLRDEIASVRARAGSGSLRWSEIEGDARQRLSDLRGAFSRSVGAARAALKELLAGPIICMPVETTEGHRYRVSGALAVGRLVSTGAFAASPTRLVESPCTELFEIPFVNGRLAA